MDYILLVEEPWELESIKSSQSAYLCASTEKFSFSLNNISKGGRRGWLGWGGVVGGKCRQLNNKITKKVNNMIV